MDTLVSGWWAHLNHALAPRTNLMLTGPKSLLYLEVYSFVVMDEGSVSRDIGRYERCPSSFFFLRLFSEKDLLAFFFPPFFFTPFFVV